MKLLPRLGRAKADDPADQLASAGHVDGAGTVGKGRPTPRRRDSSTRRVGPPPPPPRTRKEAYRRTKELSKSGRSESRGQAREKMMAGEEEYLMPRDRGPVRGHVRRIVDSRHSPTSWVFVVGLLVVLASSVPAIAYIGTALWGVLLVALAVDWVLLGRRISRELQAEHTSIPGRIRSHISYGIMRSIQFRRMRVPRPAATSRKARRG